MAKSNSDDAKELKIVTVDDRSSPEELALLKQYFAVRNEAFSPTVLYTDGVTNHDLDPDNVEATKGRSGAYILGVYNGKVIGGTGYHYGTVSTFPTFAGGIGEGKRMSMRDLLPERYLQEAGLKPEEIKYIHPFGLAVSKHEQDRGVGTRLTRDIFMAIEDKADFFQVEITTPNIAISPKVLKQIGLHAIVLPENAFVSGVSKVLIVPVLFTKKHPHVIENMLNQHKVGMSPDQFLATINQIKEEHKDWDFRNLSFEEQYKIFNALSSKVAEYKSELQTYSAEEKEKSGASWVKRALDKGRVQHTQTQGSGIKPGH